MFEPKSKNILRIFLSFLGVVLIVNILVMEVGNLVAAFNNSDSENSYQDLLRLHIRANSDDPKDQEIKNKVRDHVVTYLNDQTSGLESREKLVTYLRSEKSQLEEELDFYLAEYDIDQDVKVSLENQEFPTRRYRSKIVPNGEYQALKVKLENGQGGNWWCVLFPPLCYVDLAVASDNLETDQEKQEYGKQTNKKAKEDYQEQDTQENLEIRFVIWEWLLDKCNI